MEFRKAVPQKKKEEINAEQRLLNWPDSYYLEREPAVRLAILDAADSQGLTPEENIYRRRLFAIRYPGYGKKSGSEVDQFIKTWVEMRFLYENSGGFFGRGPNPARLRKALNAIGYFDAETKAEKEMMGRELHHMAMLYMTLCQEDKQYNSLLFGFGKLSETGQIDKIAGEMRKMSIKVPEIYGMTEECELLTRAVRTAWEDMFPDYVGYLDEKK